MSIFTTLAATAMLLLCVCAAALFFGLLIYGVMCAGAAKWLTWREARHILFGPPGPP